MRFLTGAIADWSLKTRMYGKLQVRSGSNPFERVLKIIGHSEPLTGPSVQFFPGHELWTEPRSGSAAFRFEPRFRTKRNHPYPGGLYSAIENFKKRYR